MQVQNLPETIYRIDNFGYVDSGVTEFSFIEPTADTNPDLLPVIEMPARDTIEKEASYYAAHGTHIDIPHRQLLELMCELYSV